MMNSLIEIRGLVNECTRCVLHHSRIKAVPGEGPEHSRIMFIGEGPGFHENQQGKPFVGQAGKFLDELLSVAGLKREEVFITNVVKCRPPGNRDPLPDELEACSIILNQQIALIDPDIIVTLGRFSMAKFFGPTKISMIHGKIKKINERYVVAIVSPSRCFTPASFKKHIIRRFFEIKEIFRRD